MEQTTSTSPLDQIRARVGAATDGPWASENYPDGGLQYVWAPRLGGLARDVAPADAEFIAHARTDVPKLVAALEAVLRITGHPEGSGNVVFMAGDIENAIAEALA